MTLPAWKLLGFDARENEQDGRKTPIPIDVREVMLLRPEIELPMSIDTHVWPTHFLYYPFIREAMGHRDPPLIEADQGHDGSLWLNLALMRRELFRNGRKAVLIAVELLAPADTTVAEYPSPLIYSTPEPHSVPMGSICLGFDVADSEFWSGLSNCGYSKDEREELRPEWKSKINDHGLLQTEQDALAFRELTNKRVPEHAPFWVYRLYRLSEL
jgi:hypothetical protein